MIEGKGNISYLTVVIHYLVQHYAASMISPAKETPLQMSVGSRVLFGESIFKRY